ncbi:hypothetical protein, partial [Klebsiella pneumoniae]|uniref:hypothetical protein n=1 Tax=Klebsiella pneumoniae TaxID=573 RepID=UPI0027E3F574
MMGGSIPVTSNSFRFGRSPVLVKITQSTPGTVTSSSLRTLFQAGTSARISQAPDITAPFVSIDHAPVERSIVSDGR